MRLYVDDERLPMIDPKTWTIVRDYDTAIVVLTHRWEEIEEISLDHDLGDVDLKKTGYGIACFIENLVLGEGYRPIPKLNCHSGNSVGSHNIQMAFDRVTNYIDYQNKITGFAYIRHCPNCGGVDAACVDEPLSVDDIAELRADCDKRGLELQRVPLSSGVVLSCKCL